MWPMLLIFIIGPGEEIFWRGFLQRHFSIKTEKLTGFALVTFFYTAIHFGSMNVMLILAALSCGLF